MVFSQSVKEINSSRILSGHPKTGFFRTFGEVSPILYTVQTDASG